MYLYSYRPTTSPDVVGRYERGDIKPSIDVVTKIADALEISIDFLVGKTKQEFDKKAIHCLELISELPDKNREFVLNMIDMALRDYKAKQGIL